MTNKEKIMTDEKFLIDVLVRLEQEEPSLINEISNAVCNNCKYGLNGDNSCNPDEDCKNGGISFKHDVVVWLHSEATE